MITFDNSVSEIIFNGILVEEVVVKTTASPSGDSVWKKPLDYFTGLAYDRALEKYYPAAATSSGLVPISEINKIKLTGNYSYTWGQGISYDPSNGEYSLFNAEGETYSSISYPSIGVSVSPLDKYIVYIEEASPSVTADWRLVDVPSYPLNAMNTKKMSWVGGIPVDQVSYSSKYQYYAPFLPWSDGTNRMRVYVSRIKGGIFQAVITVIDTDTGTIDDLPSIDSIISESLSKLDDANFVSVLGLTFIFYNTFYKISASTGLTAVDQSGTTFTNAVYQPWSNSHSDYLNGGGNGGFTKYDATGAIVSIVR